MRTIERERESEWMQFVQFAIVIVLVAIVIVVVVVEWAKDFDWIAANQPTNQTTKASQAGNHI